MLRYWCVAILLGAASTVAIAANNPASFKQRLAVARAELAKAGTQKSARPAAQAAVIERLFDLLDESGQLETDEAQTLANRALELRLAETPHGSTEYALALWRSAKVLGQHNRFDEATATAQRAAMMLQQQTPRDPVAEARVHITLGAILATQRKFAESIPLLEAAIAVLDAHHSVDVTLAYGLKALAFDYAETEEFDRAQAAIDRAIAIAASIEGPDSTLGASYLIVAALIPMQRGDTAAAIALLERALPLLRDAKPPMRKDYELASLTLAQTLKSSGDCQRAEPLLRNVIESEDAHPGGSGVRFLASALNSLAQCLDRQGRFAETVAFYERAAAIYRKFAGEDAPQTLMVESNLTNAYEELGRRDEEIAMLRHIIEVTDPMRASGAPDLTPARANLGYTYVWLGRYAEAEQLFRDYLSHLGPGRDLSEREPRGAMAGLAVCLWAQGHDDAAFAEALATERSRQKLVRISGADLAEQHAVKLEENALNGLDWALAIAAKDGRVDHARAVWDLAVQSRGMVSAISARRLATARAALDPQLAAVWHDWKESDETLVRARVEAARNPSAQTSAALDAAEQRFDAAERALAHAEGAHGAALGRAHADLTSILAALPPNTLLISYVEADASQPHDLNHPPDGIHHDRMYAFVASRDSTPKLLDLGPRPAIDDAAQKWLSTVTDQHGDVNARDSAGTKLRELVWDPIATHWPQKRALIVASPVLDRVPFAALPTKDGHFLVETGYAFHLLDHERDVLAVPAVNGKSTLALIGAPDFGVDTRIADAGTRGVCAGLRGATFSPLPQAAREIDELDRLWKQQAGATVPTVLTGDDANEARARAVLHGSRIAHFATHAVYLGDQCTAADDTRGIKTVETATTPVAAQDLSALVLTGANRPAASTDNDGLLTSEEVATLDLTGTEWAVLAACDTGIGKDISGEGVFGLRRAFRLAGVHSVIMSLWPVSDAASADWMLALYRARLQQHASTIDSVRAADLALIQQRRNAGLDPAPYYWAAFVAAGDWR